MIDTTLDRSNTGIHVRIFLNVVDVSVKKNEKESLSMGFVSLTFGKKCHRGFLVTTGDFTHTPDFGNEILAPVSGKAAKQLGPVWLVQE